MKQKVLYLIVVLLMCGLQTDMFAQNKGVKKGNMSSEQRIEKQADHIAKSLMLSDAKEAQFSTVYTQYLKELRRCAHTGFRFDGGKEKMDKAKLTDEQIDKMIQMRFDKCREILDVREKYYKEFKKILTARQIMKMYSIERNLGKKVQGELNRRYNKNK